MTGALIWKEWKQLRWKLIFSLVITGAYTWIGLRTRIVPDVVILAAGSLVVVFLMPIFVAMGLFANEAEEGSLSLQLRLPIAARKIYFVKMSAAAVSIVCPLILMLIISLAAAGNREVSGTDIFEAFIFSVLFALTYLVWICTFSITADSEFKVVLVAIAVVFAWGLFCILGNSFRWGAITMILTPFGFFEAGFDNHGGTAVTLVQLALGTFLFYISMIRFENLAGRQR